MYSAYGPSSHVPEEQFQCCICQEVFTDPVTTTCGHSFCKRCIAQNWDSNGFNHCTLCSKNFIRRSELKINIISRNSLILCDICAEEKHKAIKSCLDCGVALCMSHLEPHNYVPQYQKHKLIDAVKNLDKYICQKHERPLDLFCRDDKTFVCQFCTEGEHKNHSVISVEEESAERKSQLQKTQMELQQMIQERLKKIQELNNSVDLSKRNTEKDKSDSMEIFTDLICCIERSQAELLKMMDEKQKAVENQAEGLINDLEMEIDELTRRTNELEQLSHTEDHVHLIQITVDPSLYRAPDTYNWTETRINTELNVGALRMALSQLQETLNENLSVSLNEKLREMGSIYLRRIQQHAVNVTLDPQTAHPKLILSDDGKQVTCGETEQNRKDQQKRFTKYMMVMGKQGFSSGRFYYQVQVSGKPAWDLGVAKESVNRKGAIERLCPQAGFWTLVLRNGNEYTACDDARIPLTLKEKPQKVGVFVDYDEGQVSFYDVEAKSHLYSFTGQVFTEKIYPYFSPCLNDGENSAPLIICDLGTSALRRTMRRGRINKL